MSSPGSGAVGNDCWREAGRVGWADGPGDGQMGREMDRWAGRWARPVPWLGGDGAEARHFGSFGIIDHFRGYVS